MSAGTEPATREEAPHLRATLRPFDLWALGVGYVISGMYFGWNLGLPEGGPLGLLVATLLVTLLYVSFVLAYAELSCAMPQAGGAFVYAKRALGPRGALVAGAAQWMEFVFAPPAIAAAIGAYVSVLLPQGRPLVVAAGAYVLFTAINVWGVRLSAALEALVTIVAVAGLVLFAALAAPHLRFSAFQQDPLPIGWWGVLPALPYAIWFYLGIEGLANVAEEARAPQRDLPRGFGGAMATLVVLTLVAFAGAVGVAGWRAAVYAPGSTTPSDSPLPLALAAARGPDDTGVRLVALVGLAGLVASFHGLLLAAGRVTFELGRLGHLPAAIGRPLRGRGTPAAALLLNMLVGLVALATGRTGDLIVVAVFGALTMYAVSMGSFFRLRAKEPHLPRPFRTPMAPLVAGAAALLTVLCLVALSLFQPRLAGVSAVVLIVVTALMAGWRGRASA